jgi:hypothetical protein
MHNAVLTAALIGLSAAIKINEQVAAQPMSDPEAELGVTGEEYGSALLERLEAGRPMPEAAIEELDEVPSAVPEGGLETLSEAPEHVEEDSTQVREQLAQTSGSGHRCAYTIKSALSGKMLTAPGWETCGRRCWWTRFDSPRPRTGVRYWDGEDNTQLWYIERSTRGDGIYHEGGPCHWISSVGRDLPITGINTRPDLKSVRVGDHERWDGYTYSRADLRTATHWPANWVIPASSVANHFELYVESLGWVYDLTLEGRRDPYLTLTYKPADDRMRAYEIKPLADRLADGTDCRVWS